MVEAFEADLWAPKGSASQWRDMERKGDSPSTGRTSKACRSFGSGDASTLSFLSFFLPPPKMLHTLDLVFSFLIVLVWWVLSESDECSREGAAEEGEEGKPASTMRPRDALLGEAPSYDLDMSGTDVGR